MPVMTPQEHYNFINNIKPDPLADGWESHLADPRVAIVLTLTSAKDGQRPSRISERMDYLKYLLDSALLTASSIRHGKYIKGVSVAETQSNRSGIDELFEEFTNTKSEVNMKHKSLHTHTLIHSWDKRKTAEELREAMGAALMKVIPKVLGRDNKPFFSLRGVDVRVVNDTTADRKYFAKYLMKELSDRQTDDERLDMFSFISKNTFNIKTAKLDKEYDLWH